MAVRHDICEELGLYPGAKWKTAKGSRLIVLNREMKMVDGKMMVVKIDFFNVTTDSELIWTGDEAIRWAEAKQILKGW